jgi:hypothetical protein
MMTMSLLLGMPTSSSQDTANNSHLLNSLDSTNSYATYPLRVGPFRLIILAL